MKNFFILFVLILFSILTIGCQSEDDYKDYFVSAEEYLHEIDNFKKDITKIVQNNKRDLSKINRIEGRIEQMKTKIELFKSLNPPEGLKNEHDALLTYNRSIESLLNKSLLEMKSGKFISELSKDYLWGIISPPFKII
ncbi:DUF6376 family protein [Bacillus salitolerans]|uniref:DUF6376 family protein n=1 Tax=Bacillus salitolerans TaxID=1437434 RepID=A0ABW4LP78_9BACI